MLAHAHVGETPSQKITGWKRQVPKSLKHEHDEIFRATTQFQRGAGDNMTLTLSFGSCAHSGGQRPSNSPALLALQGYPMWQG